MGGRPPGRLCPCPGAAEGFCDNRLFGALLALLGTAIFAALYAGGAAVVIAITPGARLDASFLGFVNNSAFWVPVLFYVVAAVVVALLLNRAAWWAHVIGSAVVALVVYWGSAGLLTLLTDVTQQTPDQAATTFWSFAASPILFIAAILAREVALWIGLAISARGRKLRMRNAEAKAAYDAEQAEKKAEMSERRRRSDFAVALFVTILRAAVVFAVDGIIAIVLDRDPIQAGTGTARRDRRAAARRGRDLVVGRHRAGERFALVVGARLDRTGLPLCWW